MAQFSLLDTMVKAEKEKKKDKNYWNIIKFL